MNIQHQSRWAWILSGLFLVLISLSLPNKALAKDLASRLGVGYSNQFGVEGGLPSIAVRYYPNPELGLSTSLGVDTQKDNAKFGFLAKLFRVIFMEDNMNFYMGGGAGLVSQERGGENDSGFELSGFIGGEYFFPGLESLGFIFEAGVGVTSISSEVRFRTIGDHPFNAGIVFYF